MDGPIVKRMSKRNLTRICPVCDYQFANKVFDVHLSSHHEDPLTYSSDMKDACRTVCRICEREMILTRLRGHTKDKHGMSITDYKVTFNLQAMEITEKVFHKCALCSDIMLLDSDSIAAHLHKHNIAHRTYNDKYMNMAVPRKGPPGPTTETKRQITGGVFERHLRSKLDISHEEVQIIDVAENDEGADKSELDNAGDITKLKSELETIFQKPKPIQKGQRSRRFLSHYDMHLIAWPHECMEVY